MAAERSLLRELNRMFVSMLPKNVTVANMVPTVYGLSAENVSQVKDHAIKATNAFRNLISVLMETGDTRVLDLTERELDALQDAFVRSYEEAIVRKFVEANASEFDRIRRERK